MRKTILFLILLITLPSALAGYDNNFLDAQELILQSDISSSLNITSQSSASIIDQITVDLLLFPRNNLNQEIISFDPTPQPQQQENHLRFQWHQPEEEKISFGIKSKVKLINKRKKITTKVSYPLGELPKDILIYTKPSTMIDSDNQVISGLASQLIEGEDDLYLLTHKIAEWVATNINYSLDSLTADAVQKPSWVLSNRYGVCDEITSLFIAMMRSLGVPARYVSGVAYTNWNNINDWGPHAWAEVYFPNFGWIPYDVTYGQLGFIDPTHIVLKISEDSESTSTKYEWKGRHVDLDTNKLEIKTKLLDTIGIADPQIDVKVNIAKAKLKPGSFNLVEGTIRNLNPYYTSAEITMARTNEVFTNDKLKRQVILAPSEEKKIFWKIQVSEDLNPEYIYTFPVEIYSSSNISDKIIFTSSIHSPRYSEEEINKELSIKNIVPNKQFTANLDFICENNNEMYYIDEKAIITCRLTNNGNQILKDLRVCLVNDCKKISILLSQTNEITFEKGFDSSGKKEYLISATNSEVNKPFYLNIDVHERPGILIKDITSPSKVKYDDNFDIEFTLEKKSTPHNVTVNFIHSSQEKTWDIGIMNNNRVFKIQTEGKALNLGANDFKINTVYTDTRGKTYSVVKEFHIDLINLTLLQKITIYLRNFGMSLEKLFRE